MRKLIALCLSLLLLLSTAGCGTPKEQQTVQKTTLLMDTVVTITLYDWTDETTIDTAFEEISRLEDLLNVDHEGSEKNGWLSRRKQKKFFA